MFGLAQWLGLSPSVLGLIGGSMSQGGPAEEAAAPSVVLESEVRKENPARLRGNSDLQEVYAPRTFGADYSSRPSSKRSNKSAQGPGKNPLKKKIIRHGWH